MAEEGTPGRALGWWERLSPWLERGTPVTLLVLLILGGATLWFQSQEVKRLHTSQSDLVRLLLEAKDAQVSMALRIGNCEGKGSRGEGPMPMPPTPTVVPLPWDMQTWQCAAF